MKRSIFLLGTILISAPYAFGQTAPLAVQAPVAEATAPMASDAELQAKVALAAQALAKLPDSPGLTTAKERVSQARELVVVPIGFSLGQRGRQARLVLDNLRSARVWCQANLQTAKADDKVLLNEAIELLQRAEKMAQQKVDILDKPNGRTAEETVVYAKRLIKESKAFSKLSKEQALASDNRLKKMRAESAESMRKFQEAKKAFDALPKPSPVDEQQELKNKKKREQEVEAILRSLTPEVTAAMSAENEASKRFQSDVSKFTDKINSTVALAEQLARPVLSPEKQRQIRSQLKVAQEEKEDARKAYQSSLENLQVLQKRAKELRDSIELKKTALLPEISFRSGREIKFQLIQNNQQNVEQLRLAMEAARTELSNATAALVTASNNLNLALDAVNQLAGASNARESAIRAANQAQQQYDAAHALSEGLALTLLNIQANLRNAELQTATATANVATAQAAYDAAVAALDDAFAGQCPAPDVVDALMAAVDAASAVLTAATTALTNAENAEAIASVLTG